MQQTAMCVQPGRDPVELLLRRIALGALHGSLLVVGCADEGSELGQRPSDYDPCAQRESGFPVRASELHLAQPADYVAVREAMDSASMEDAGADAWTRTTFTTVSEQGTACASATTNACAEKVARHPAQPYPSYCVDACLEWSLVTTRGDEVQRWVTPAQLVLQLGTIDSYDEALLLAASRGYNVSCPGDTAPSLVEVAARASYVRQVEGGYELFATTYTDLCPIVLRRHHLRISSTGELSELASRDFKMGNACIGRIPAGLVAAPTRQAESLAEYLAACAHLEAASVFAFERLARELRAHGAPPALIARAREAACDEVRHARAIGALARARGMEPPTPRVDHVAIRSIEEIALENAVEGCVRETYGAVVGAYQAQRARDPQLRFAMRSIAVDEARHAALSHDLQAWLTPQLNAAAARRVSRAQQAMIVSLCAVDHDSELRELAGLPSVEVAHGMLAALQRELWSRAVA